MVSPYLVILTLKVLLFGPEAFGFLTWLREIKTTGNLQLVKNKKISRRLKKVSQKITKQIDHLVGS